MPNDEMTDNAVALWAEEVGAIYDTATERGDVFLEAGFLAIAPHLAAQIKKETGLDVAGYKHIVDTSSVRHILKHHGTQAEYKRGQVPITRQDFVQLASVLVAPDLVEYAGKTKQGRNVLCYTKTIGEHIVVYTEEVRTKRGRLAAVTLYKRKIKER